MKVLVVLILVTLIQKISSWCLKTTLSQRFSINEVDWAPDNSIFVTASRGQKVVRIYDAKTFELLKIHNNSGNQPRSVKISKDSKWIGIGYDNSDLQILHSTPPFNLYHSRDTGQTKIAQVDFSYDNQLIMSCGDDKRFKAYDITTKTLSYNQLSNPNPDTARACRYGPLGHIAYADDNQRIKVYFPQTNQVFQARYPDDVQEIDFKPNSDLIGTVDQDGILRLANSTILFDDSDDLLTISIGRMGNYYAIGGKTKTLFVYEQSTNKVVAKFNNFKDSIQSVKISPDQNFMITGDDSGEVRIYALKCSFSCESGQYNESGVCKKCASIIPYCVNCKSAAICDNCMVGFYNIGSSCVPCFNNLKYCLACKDANQCTKCLDGYYLESGKCVKCSLQGCIQCNDSLICTKCFTYDYYLDTTANQCKRCADSLSNCIRCTDSATCVDCQLGFYEDSTTKKCLQCPGNCLICQTNNNCSQCKVGYWASGGSCVRCSDSNCISCNQTGVCYDCKQGMFLTNTNSCSKCINPCSTCSVTATNCTGCIIGYYFDGTAFKCEKCIQNCKICNESTKCLSCFPGFAINPTTFICQPCSEFYNNCSQCTESQCLKCRQAFYLDSTSGNICKTCISAIPYCIQCANSSKCFQCVKGYYPTGSTGTSSCAACPAGCSECISSNNCTKCFKTFYLNSSLLCTPCKNNCFECSTETNCNSCLVGYYLDTSVCKACSTVLAYCSFCSNGITCRSCLPGSYLDITDNKCKLCKNNCIACNQTDCFSCQVGYYLDNTATSITCEKCSEYCQQCTSSSVCTSCIDGYYFDSADNKCKSCGSAFSHCTLCNKTNCFQCVQGSILDTSTAYTCIPCNKFISDCKTCYWDNSLATPTVKCSFCNYAYGLSSTNLSCFQCNTMQGCIDCISTSQCRKCQIGYYLKADKTCGLCAEKCFTCENALSCISCRQGYVNDGSDCVLCENKIDGCSKCVPDTGANFNCTYCQVGYYLQLSDKKCYICNQKINGCYTCNDSSTCTSCLDKYFLDSMSGKCKKCVTNMPGCQLCNSSSECISCQDSYYLDITTHQCIFCSDNILGCLHCKDHLLCSQCLSGFYLKSDNTCGFCQSTLQGCVYCNSNTECIQCRPGFYLDTSDDKCKKCPSPGCEVCSQTNPNICFSCSSKFYLNANTCSDCTNLVPFCYECNNTQCIECQVGYYLDAPLTCTRCSTTMSGCSRCNDDSTCLECMSSYFVNGSNLCQQCNQVLFGCQNCINGSVCISCEANFFLNSSTDKCQSCTDLPGCQLCKNESTCVLCQQKYYMEGSECKLCSAVINGCFSCVSETVCVQCQSGYVLDPESYECVINTIEANEKVQGLKLVSYYVSSGMLKHILFAKGIKFRFNESLNITAGGKTKLLIEDYSGKQIQLNILSYEFAKNSYSIIFYTDNPLGSEINLGSKKMSFRRLIPQEYIGLYQCEDQIRVVPKDQTGMLIQRQLRLLSEQQINLQVLLKMDQGIYNQILPDLDYSGAMTVGYSLNDPQFTKSYLQVEAAKDYIVFQVIGIIFIVLFLINYILKFMFTLPHSRNRHSLLPHIISLKACCLIIYPSHFEYMSFCKGFMIVDIHWANQAIAAQLTDLSDKVPVPFGLFFDNLSIAGTFLLGFAVYILLLLVVQGWYYMVTQEKKSQKSSQQSEISSSEERRRDKQFKIQKLESIIGVNYDNDESESNKTQLMRRNMMELLWNIFSFSVVYYSCLSVQGGFYNFLQIITVNGVFYIMGILLFIYVTIEAFYSFIRNYKLINKLRVYIKACLLSLAYLNPIYVASVCVAFDIMLIVLQFYLINKKNQLSKWFTISHILNTISILFMIFISSSLLSLFLTGISLLTCLGLQIYIHYKQYQIAHQSLDIIQSHSNTQNMNQNFQSHPNHLWDLPKTKIDINNNQMYATMEEFNQSKNFLAEDNDVYFIPKNKTQISQQRSRPFQHQNTLLDNQIRPHQKKQKVIEQGRKIFEQKPRPSSTKQGGRRNKLRKTQQAFKSNVIEILPRNEEQKIETIFDFEQGEDKQEKTS